MPKIKISYMVKSSDNHINKEIIGIKRDNNIIFNDDNNKFNIEIISNKIILKKENEDSILEMIIGDDYNIKYYLKEYHKYLDLDMKLIKFKINNNGINFKYSINNNDTEFTLEYEVI